MHRAARLSNAGFGRADFIPPGAAAEPHFVLEGRIETNGRGLAQSQVNDPGDFLFIPAGLPHQPVNLSTTAPARAIVARNDASQHESVVPYDPAADGGPHP